MGGWNVDVGGALSVHDAAGTTVALRPKERAIVSALALLHPDAVPVADLAELVWIEPPETARKSIHNHVARLRRVADGLVESVSGGYRLGDSVEVVAPTTDDVFRDLVDRPEVAVTRTRFRDARLNDEEQRATSILTRRPSDDDIDTLEAMAEAEPHRLERWRLVVLALARRGRRRDALDRIRRARSRAASAPEDHRCLDQLERAVLDDDPRIEVDHFLAAPPSGSARAGDPNAGVTRAHDLFVDAGGILDRLVAHLDAGAPGCVLVTGPAGSGKSTVCLRARDRAIALGWECHHVTARSHAAADATVEASLRRSIDERRDEPHPGPLAELLTGDRRRRLVLVDDVHHASSDDVRAIVDLVHRTADAGQVWWIIASRDRPGLHDATDVAMAPWDTAAVSQLLHRFVPTSPWLDGAARWIAEQSDGNALTIRELVVELVRRRDTTTDDLGGFRPPTDSAAPIGWVRHRIDRLDDDTRRALSGAAMVGPEFALTTLAAFTNDASGVAAQARLDGVITSAPGDRPRFRFVHDLFRDVLLDGLDEQRRSELALVALRDPMFDDDRESRRRSMLARQAVRDDPERAITETIDAAQLEIDRQSPVEAERLLRRAVELIERHDDLRDLRWCEALLQLGSVAVSNGSGDAIDILLRCARLAIDLRAASIAVRAVSEASRVGLGSTVGTADTEIATTIEVCRRLPLDVRERARLDLAEMSVYGIGTDGRRARTLLDAALHAAAEAADPNLTALVQRSAYMSVLRPQDIPARRRISADLRLHGATTGDRTSIYEATRLDFSIAVEAGEDDPRPILAALEEMHAEFRERSRNWSLFSFQAAVAYLDGDVERLQNCIDLILSPETVVSMPLKLSTAGGHQLGMHLLRRNVEQLDPVVAHIESSTPGLPAWNAARALTSAAAGDEATARDRLRRSCVERNGSFELDLPDDFTGLPAAFLLGEAAMIVGDDLTLDLAMGALRPHSGLWLWHGTGTFGPVDLALARWSRGRDDELGPVADLARRALISTSSVGAPHLTADAARLLAATTRFTPTREAQ